MSNRVVKHPEMLLRRSIHLSGRGRDEMMHRGISSSQRAPSRCSATLPGSNLTSIWPTKRMRGAVVSQAALSSPPKEKSKSGSLADSLMERKFELRGGCSVQLTVEINQQGDQIIHLLTDLQAGALLLHWGVEGGRDYKGGWRLPSSPGCQPPGTRAYKNRALQTPWVRQSDGETSALTIELKGEEASDAFNFVVKDDATNTWWDNNGSNFTVSLRPHASADSSSSGANGNNSSSSVVLPKDLCDKWSWMIWDQAGRPKGRGDQAASESYEASVKDMEKLLAMGRPIDELWAVANGTISYKDYASKHGLKGQAPSSPSQSPSAAGPVPEDLLAVQAYILWEKAGKPDGADFSEAARRSIEEEVKKGSSFEQVAARLKHTPKWTSNNVITSSVAATKTAPLPSSSPPAPAQVGRSLGSVRSRNPLDLIKQKGTEKKTPVLSEGKATKEVKPLDYLVERFSIDPETKWRRTYAMGGKSELFALVRQGQEDKPVRVDLVTDMADEVVLHWGLCKPGSKDWTIPAEKLWPEESEVGGPTAVDTRMRNCDDDECDVEISGAKVPLQRISLLLPPDHQYSGLTFVLRSADKTMWYKDAGGNFFIPLPGKNIKVDLSKDSGGKKASASTMPDDLSRAIVESENSSAWTLMHRFNRATDLLSEVLNGYFEDLNLASSTSILYCWLRYSSTRLLTWQRNYNTQPRILSAAQERLTIAIAQAHSKTTGEAQEWVRMMLGCVGRGGDGQKIRDEILHIMHRNHISERKGSWMEEWHQKLHNNTTPDDVPICQAYLAFLQANGNVQAYWRVLSDAGVSRQRLESFDRPITLEPEYYGDKRNALIGEFTNYLGILKAVHSGADLQSSASAAGGRVPESARGYLGYVLGHVGDSQVLPLMEAAVEARSEIAGSITGNRELIYLDLALEDQVRQAAERGIGSSGFGAAAFMKPLLQNLCLSLGDNEELCYCLKTWQELPQSVRTGGRPNKDEALQAVAVVNRIRRAISEVSDRCVNRIGTVGSMMGEACGVERWASELFAEEVVRGGPAFAISLLLSTIDPFLRNVAALGSWQVISPNQATGVVEIVPGLHEVQDKVYETPTVLIAMQVTGEEEIPEGVVAVLTPDAPDVLSHVSVRARNMKVLFATCHDSKPLDEIRAYAGKTLTLATTAAGSVNWQEAKAGELSSEADKHAKDKAGNRGLRIEVPKWCGKWAVQMDEYAPGVVGAKSKNLAGLRGKLPSHIRLPSSVTLPFGCFEQALEAKENHAIRDKIKTIVGILNGKKPASAPSSWPIPSFLSPSSPSSSSSSSSSAAPVNVAELLAECRQLALQVSIPSVVRSELQAAMQAAGIPLPTSEERWTLALNALRGVWASKYNDRAYYSLKKVGLDFDDVRMAVLVQQVVPAHYAFVIHTRNPSNNDESEVFCEMVRGLGESLVSGMVPGSALAFKSKKVAKGLEEPELLCYASKGEGMFVPSSLIFRSDSNGEDLDGYAGAGLYDSITMDETVTRKVDYMDDPLVKDAGYRRKLLSQVCKVGASIEVALGSAQDIEGVVSEDGSITVVQTRPQV